MELKVLRLAANLYWLQTTEGRLLIDTGLPRGRQPQKLLQLLEGVEPDAIFLTHHHTDHSGGVVALLQKRSVPVYAHPREFPYLTKQIPRPAMPVPGLGALIANACPAIPESALHPVQEGDRILGLEVVHLFGHTLGLTGLLGEGVLFAGDAVRVNEKGPFFPNPRVNEDSEETLKSLAKIGALGAAQVYPGHGPATSSAAVADLVRRL